MANNCLVTKLKSAVDNADLCKIGEFPIILSSDSLVVQDVKAVNGIRQGNTPMAISNNNYHLTGAGTKYIIDLAYSIPEGFSKQFRAFCYNSSNKQPIDLYQFLVFRTFFQSLFFQYFKLENIENVSFSGIHILEIPGCATNKKDINTFDFGINLSTLTLNQSDVIGELSTLLNALAAAGKATNLTVVFNGKITLNGTTIADEVTKTFTFSNGSWSEQ